MSHPASGIGGRTIELSLSVGRERDPEAFNLAGAELHSHLLSEDLPTAHVLEDARWLMSLSGARGILRRLLRRSSTIWKHSEGRRNRSSGRPSCGSGDPSGSPTI